MTVERDRPYGHFNFRLRIGDGPETGTGGFSEVSGLSNEGTVTDARPGPVRDTKPRMVVGATRHPIVTLRRGTIEHHDLLRSWGGDAQRPGLGAAPRTVRIQRVGEDGTSVVREWKLTNARPIKYTGGAEGGEGGEGGEAIEELVLTCDGIELV